MKPDSYFEPYAKAAFTKAIGILDAPKVKWDDLPNNPKQAWIEGVKEVFYMLNVQSAETGEFYVERESAMDAPATPPQDDNRCHCGKSARIVENGITCELCGRDMF